MKSTDRILGMYLHLARASQLRRQPMVRDRMLVLAGITAVEMGLDEISAECRERVLAHNTQHLLGDWPTIKTALEDARFQAYARQLRRRYSPEKVEHLLDSLGVEWVNERAAYYTDEEYAAALLAATPQAEPLADAADASAASDSRHWSSRWRWVIWGTLLAMCGCLGLMAWLWR